jgi:hypothetical protein
MAQGSMYREHKERAESSQRVAKSRAQHNRWHRRGEESKKSHVSPVSYSSSSIVCLSLTGTSRLARSQTGTTQGNSGGSADSKGLASAMAAALQSSAHLRAHSLTGTRQSRQQPVGGESPATTVHDTDDTKARPTISTAQRAAGEKGSSRAFGGSQAQAVVRELAEC